MSQLLKGTHRTLQGCGVHAEDMSELGVQSPINLYIRKTHSTENIEKSWRAVHPSCGSKKTGSPTQLEGSSD